ncbi:CsbD family protein [Rhodanobacter hydrolyticus]
MPGKLSASPSELCGLLFDKDSREEDQFAPIRNGRAPAAKASNRTMDKNRTEGTKHEVKGAIKEVVGKVTGNKAKEASGNIEKNAGKVQNAVGKAADRARDEAKKH